MKPFRVYILASDRNGTVHTGHTDDLAHRVWQHREELTKGFTSRYGVKKLVWFDAHPTREAAKIREYRIKKWRRHWKLHLIESQNPDWKDLYLDLGNWYTPPRRFRRRMD